MEYQKIFPSEEIQELVDWFEAHKDQLPPSLQLDQATYIPDLPQTVSYYIDIANRYRNSRTFTVQIFHLFKMRDKLRELGLVND